MRNKLIAGGVMGAFFLIAIVSLMQCSQSGTDSTAGKVERGRYLVMAGGCNDCHTPKLLVDGNVVLDSTRFLSGHPADEPLPPFPADVVGPGKWGAVGSGSFTAWYGPWGVSFAANLTPDMVTGSGAWTEQSFISAMRSGKHLGAGRPILPPMPWPNLAGVSDDDLAAIFAYLKTIRPVENMVPPPLPPDQVMAQN